MQYNISKFDLKAKNTYNSTSSSDVLVSGTVNPDDDVLFEKTFPKSASDSTLLTEMFSKLLESTDLSPGLTFFSDTLTVFCRLLLLNLVYTPAVVALVAYEFLVIAVSFFPSGCTAWFTAWQSKEVVDRNKIKQVCRFKIVQKIRHTT